MIVVCGIYFDFLFFRLLIQIISGCPGGWYPHYHHTRGSGYNCFRIFTNKMDWEEAERYCESQANSRGSKAYASLANVHDKETVSFLTDLMRKTIGTIVEVWLGGVRCRHKGWRECNDGWSWYKGNGRRGYRFKHFNWRQGEPNNADGGENCLMGWMHGSSTGKWNDAKCSKEVVNGRTYHYKFRFICQVNAIKL